MPWVIVIEEPAFTFTNDYCPILIVSYPYLIEIGLVATSANNTTPEETVTG